MVCLPELPVNTEMEVKLILASRRAASCLGASKVIGSVAADRPEGGPWGQSPGATESMDNDDDDANKEDLQPTT